MKKRKPMSKAEYIAEGVKLLKKMKKDRNELAQLIAYGDENKGDNWRQYCEHDPDETLADYDRNIAEVEARLEWLTNPGPPRDPADWWKEQS
ncbi:MAG: hypothetical protein JOZ53_04605 [Planctomycetaceae bacterium]|nr:hypothetical protein [Planctomycetaceae bacterium]